MTTMAQDDRGNPYPAFRLGSTSKVAYTSTAGTITTGGLHTLVRVWCSTAAHVATGASATATTSDMPLAAEQEAIFVIAAGDQVSAIQQSSGGTLYVTELF